MRGDAPEGQGGVRITVPAYSPRPRFASATPLINEGGKGVCISEQSTTILHFLHYNLKNLICPLFLSGQEQVAEQGLQAGGLGVFGGGGGLEDTVGVGILARR